MQQGKEGKKLTCHILIHGRLAGLLEHSKNILMGGSRRHVGYFLVFLGKKTGKKDMGDMGVSCV